MIMQYSKYNINPNKLGGGANFRGGILTNSRGGSTSRGVTSGGLGKKTRDWTRPIFPFCTLIIPPEKRHPGGGEGIWTPPGEQGPFHMHKHTLPSHMHTHNQGQTAAVPNTCSNAHTRFFKRWLFHAT